LLQAKQRKIEHCFLMVFSMSLSPVSQPSASNFLRSIVQNDLSTGINAARRWAGQPGLAATHAPAQLDVQPVRMRFPPEPNGYLHIGHAKSICLNFGLAHDFGGVCHLRFDDTNPEKESLEFECSIVDAVDWLGFDYGKNKENLYYASNYFDAMHACAVHLIEQGLAYVDEQSADDMRTNRGDFGKAGVDSPFRNRTITENLARFAQMRAGELLDGAAVLRAKIDMASPNINLRDPSIYRIRRAHHHRTGDAWCIYPMYTFAHPIEDALENITHSICTLEFEDQRPFYDWLLGHLAKGGLINSPPPHQYEFARLNLTYVVTSKRKLAQLVNEKHVQGWDDPRMPTLVGLRRRGYTPAAIKLFCERIGVTKADSWIDYSTLEMALRDTLDPTAARAMAVLNPVKLVITNFPEGTYEDCIAPVNPHDEAQGKRSFQFGRELWIEVDDFQAVPEKGFFRLTPPANGALGSRVRLKYGFVIECTGFKQDAAGKVTEVHATYFDDSKSGSATSGNYKVKGVIGWAAAHDALQAEVRLYDRLFSEAQPDAGGKDFLTALNANSLSTVKAYVEPSLASASAGDAFQFERLGYFVADRIDSTAGKLVFNRAVGLKDGWGK
jgi:glutaminyl-tRNA synthetase